MASNKKPAHRSEPRWDNSRNVATYSRKMTSITSSILKDFGAIYQMGIPVDDGAGNYTYTSSKRSDEWMRIKTLKLEQIFDYRGKKVKATHLIKVRYEVTIEESDHIILDSVTYEVIHIDTDTERNLFKVILCTELR